MTHNKYNENIFTKILRGEIDINKVYEDKYAVAFYDINPDIEFKFHVLVIPKNNRTNFSDFSLENNIVVGNFFKSVNEVIKKLKIKNFRLETNSGNLALIHHFHVHIKGEKKKILSEKT